MNLISLTGDRPSGKLHLGHYIGSLITRLEIQSQYTSYILIADTQTMTDRYLKANEIQDNIVEIMKDYLAVGLDQSIFCLQSQVLELYELSILLMNYVSLNRVMQNPTVKHEVKLKGDQNLGFLIYPIAQAADILGFNADIVPVGEDQLPMIEQTNNLVNKINDLYDKKIFNLVEAKLSKTKRLIGLDGKYKASKTLNNAIYLSDNDSEIQKKVYSMYTDANHIKISDPGQIENNVVFEYLDAFARNQEEIVNMKEHYIRGGLGDMTIKKYLYQELVHLINPIREKRLKLRKNDILELLQQNTDNSRIFVQKNVYNFKKKIDFILHC